jgi:predicted transcriptional regulator
MHEEILREIGLSPNEARVYEALLRIGESSVQKISTKSGVHRRNVYDALTKLTDKGLVAQVVLKGEKNFRVTDPQRLATILKDKEDRLAQALPQMQEQFQTIKHEEQAYIYRGVRGFRNYMQDILDVGEDFYAIGAKGGWFDPRLSAFRIRFYKEFKRKKIIGWHLFDWEMRKHVKMDIDTPVKIHKKHARFLPPKYSTNSAIDFFGDRVVTFTGLHINQLEDDLVQFVLISRKLAENYRKWFWLMWEASIPYEEAVKDL